VADQPTGALSSLGVALLVASGHASTHVDQA